MDVELKNMLLKERFEKYNGENLAKDFSWMNLKVGKYGNNI